MMKNLLKNPMRVFTYIVTLLSYVFYFWAVSFLFLHRILEFNPLLVYLGNIGLMISVLIDDKLSNDTMEWLYKKIKREGFVKKQLRKRLAENRWKPSMKAALYLYYMICLIGGRVLLLSGDGAFSNSYFMQSLKSYFSEMYYVLILFLGTDKFKEYIFKESKYRDKYYRQYEEEEEEEGKGLKVEL